MSGVVAVVVVVFLYRQYCTFFQKHCIKSSNLSQVTSEYSLSRPAFLRYGYLFPMFHPPTEFLGDMTQFRNVIIARVDVIANSIIFTDPTNARVYASGGSPTRAGLKKYILHVTTLLYRHLRLAFIILACSLPMRNSQLLSFATLGINRIVSYPLCLGLAIRNGIIFIKLERNTVHTMSLVGGCIVPLTLENITEMTPAIRTYDLGPLHAKSRIGMSRHGSGDAVEIGGPSTSGFEFMCGLVQRCIAARACVYAF